MPQVSLNIIGDINKGTCPVLSTRSCQKVKHLLLMAYTVLMVTLYFGKSNLGEAYSPDHGDPCFCPHKRLVGQSSERKQCSSQLSITNRPTLGLLAFVIHVLTLPCREQIAWIMFATFLNNFYKDYLDVFCASWQAS